MAKGKFVNRKLAKRSGHAQRQARWALAAARGSKSPSPQEKRAIISKETPDRNSAGTGRGVHARS
jgi:hypothetical protein